MILAGKVRLGDTVADKPGRLVAEDCLPLVSEPPHPFVGRGGLKLQHALAAFQFSPKDKTAVDVGASTGGFTDCLLQAGAKKVFAADVGYGQLDWKLQSDARVVVLDRVNARHLTQQALGEPVDVAVVDVAFISIKLILPAAMKLLKPGGRILSLVKPQFEVGKEQVENKGVIKDPKKHLEVLRGAKAFVEAQGWSLTGLTESPITGQKGNREFFIQCVAEPGRSTVDEETILSIAGQAPASVTLDPIVDD